MNKADSSAAVKATKPLAYYRLKSAKGASETGSTAYETVGGVTSSRSGAPTGATETSSALLNGRDAWIRTTQTGGIGRAGSMMAWVKLAALPGTERRILYVAGESQTGNDFDLQFDTDNSLMFFTAAGGRVAFRPDPKTLVDQWHMIVVTMDAAGPNKSIYWDGQRVAQDRTPNGVNKTAPFTIGESPVFRGRFFHGAIDEVALWNRALRPEEVAAIYNSR